MHTPHMRKRRKIMLLAVGVIAYRFPFFKTFAALLCRRQIQDASSFAAIEPADTTVNDRRIACSSLYALPLPSRAIQNWDLHCFPLLIGTAIFYPKISSRRGLLTSHEWPHRYWPLNCSS